MSIEPETILTMGGDLRIVDASDDSAPLLEVHFSNEWERRYRALSDASRMVLGEAIQAVTSQTFKNRV